ncbi:MAG: hypothetical protein ACRCU0_04935 [Candidatus Rhabdochlamydia sp.]
MLNPIQAFGYVNSAIQNNTSCSFSTLSKTVNKIALPIIALASLYISTVAAKDHSCPRDSEYYSNTCSTYPNYDDCITFCLEDTIQYDSFLHELGTCVRMCVDYFPI